MILVDIGVWLAAIWGSTPITASRRDGSTSGRTTFSLPGHADEPASTRYRPGHHGRRRSHARRVFDRLWADNRILWAEEPRQIEAAFRAISARNDHGHKVWTDDYLAAFAQTSGASLATLDTKLRERYPSVQVDQLI